MRPIDNDEHTPFLATVLPSGVVAQACALIIPGRLREEDWTEIGRALSRLNVAWQWWLGDWWAHGKRHEYGARAALVAADDWAGPGFQACEDIATVCRATKWR